MTSQPLFSPANKTEERILQNALQHFCNFGYNGTSVREITAASEVTKPTLYYYFKNKEELFIRLADNCFRLILEHLSPTSEGETFEASVQALFKRRDKIAEENPAALKFIQGLVVAPQRGTPDVGVKAFVLKVEEQLDNILKSAVQRGECLENKRFNMRIIFGTLLGFHPLSATHLSGGTVDSRKLEALLQSLCKCSGNSNCPP